jgi:hypothetical protein
MERRFKVRAQVSTDDPEAVEPVLRRLVGAAGYRIVADGFEIDADLDGEDARQVNPPWGARYCGMREGWRVGRGGDCRGSMNDR